MVSTWLVSPLLAKDWARRSSKPLPRNCCTYLDTRGRGSHYVLLTISVTWPSWPPASACRWQGPPWSRAWSAACGTSWSRAGGRRGQWRRRPWGPRSTPCTAPPGCPIAGPLGCTQHTAGKHHIHWHTGQWSPLLVSAKQWPACYYKYHVWWCDMCRRTALGNMTPSFFVVLMFSCKLSYLSTKESHYPFYSRYIKVFFM